MNKRLHCVYYGRVQGVGFRFTAERIAGGLNLSGWVKNNNDGSVEVTAEGEEESLNDFISRIKDYFGRYISDSRLSWSAATNEFKGFETRFR